MIMKRNPIAITPLPLAGRQLDPNWKKSTNDFGGNFDRRDLENMWLTPNWSAKLSADNVQSVIRGARLSSTPSGV
jgi:hypothetical protein